MLLPRKVKTNRLDLWSEKQYLQWSAYNSFLICHCRPCENNVKKMSLQWQITKKNCWALLSYYSTLFLPEIWRKMKSLKSLKLQQKKHAHVVSKRTCKKVMPCNQQHQQPALLRKISKRYPLDASPTRWSSSTTKVPSSLVSCPVPGLKNAPQRLRKWVRNESVEALQSWYQLKYQHYQLKIT